MNNFLDPLATKNIILPIKLILEPIVGSKEPDVNVTINNNVYHNGFLKDRLTIETSINLLDSVCIKITMSNKVYLPNVETAVIVKSLTIDDCQLVDLYSCNKYISYQKDQTNNYLGFYLGFNGTWQFEIQEPFYRWLHTATGQGWLLAPTPNN
jgi:hypothetical protein